MRKLLKVIQWVFFSSLVFFFLTLLKSHNSEQNDEANKDRDAEEFKDKQFVKEFQHLGEDNLYSSKQEGATL